MPGGVILTFSPVPVYTSFCTGFYQDGAILCKPIISNIFTSKISGLAVVYIRYCISGSYQVAIAQSGSYLALLNPLCVCKRLRKISCLRIFKNKKLNAITFRSIVEQRYQFQKQPLRGVPKKRCSENMQQIYRRTPMPKCDFRQLSEIALRHGCSPKNLLHIFRTPILQNTSEWLLLQFFQMLV